MTTLRIRELGDDFGPLKIWRRPTPDAAYVIGVDVSQGVAPTANARASAKRAERTLDYSCAMVLEMDTAALCASWHGSSDTRVFSQEVYHLGIYYNTALIAVETNGLGISVQNNLETWEYPNLFYEATVTFRPQHAGGFSSSPRKKGILIDSLHAYLAEPDAYIPDLDLLHEMRTLQKIAGKGHGAAENHKDDRVFAYGLAHYVLADERPTAMPVGTTSDPYQGLPAEEAAAWKMIHGRRGPSGRMNPEDN